MKKNSINKNTILFLIIICAVYIALTVLSLIFIPWVGYTLLFFSTILVIMAELKYIKRRHKMFEQLKRQGALFEFTGFKVTHKNGFIKIKVVAFKDKIMLYNSSLNQQYGFGFFKSLETTPKTSSAYGGFSAVLNNGEVLRVMCLNPKKILEVYNEYRGENLTLKSKPSNIEK